MAGLVFRKDGVVAGYEDIAKDPGAIANDLCALVAVEYGRLDYTVLTDAELAGIQNGKGELERLMRERSRRLKSAKTSEQVETLRSTGQLFWRLLNGLFDAEMKQNPPIQLADMLAWSENRLNARGDWVKECLSVTDAIPGRRLVYGEAELRRVGGSV